MSAQLILVFTFGVIFILLLLGIAVYLTVRKDDRPVPALAIFIFRVVLALAGAGIGAILPGFLNLQAKVHHDRQRFAIEVINHIESPEASSIPQRIAQPETPKRHEIANKNDRGQI